MALESSKTTIQINPERIIEKGERVIALYRKERRERVKKLFDEEENQKVADSKNAKWWKIFSKHTTPYVARKFSEEVFQELLRNRKTKVFYSEMTEAEKMTNWGSETQKRIADLLFAAEQSLNMRSTMYLSLEDFKRVFDVKTE